MPPVAGSPINARAAGLQATVAKTFVNPGTEMGDACGVDPESRDRAIPRHCGQNFERADGSVTITNESPFDTSLAASPEI